MGSVKFTKLGTLAIEEYEQQEEAMKQEQVEHTHCVTAYKITSQETLATHFPLPVIQNPHRTHCTWGMIVEC